MKAKEIQDLIDFIAKSGLDEVNIETEQFKITVKRQSTSTPKLSEATPVGQPILPLANSLLAPTPPTISSTVSPTFVPAVLTETPAKTDNYITVKSPMIGTFYRSANPDAPSFTNVGDSIKKGQVVCIIEAMKLFNEIESEVSGRIVKVLIDNASPVEYDQPLFLVDPS